jgi:hypothetical protein
MNTYKIITSKGRVLLIKSDTPDNAMKIASKQGHNPVSVMEM